MAKKYTGQLTSDRVLAKIETALGRKDKLDSWLRATLDTLPNVLNEVGNVDLAEQHEALLALRLAADEAIKRNNEVRGKIGAAAGHMTELGEAVSQDRVLEDLADVATIIKNEAVYFEAHAPTVRAVLEIVDPAIFEAAWGELSPERRAALLSRMGGE